jgi:ABC-2 type transport system permease protein
MIHDYQVFVYPLPCLCSKFFLRYTQDICMTRGRSGSWQKYGWVGLIAARSSLAYAGEVATRIIFLGVILFIFLQLWRVTYAGTAASELGGFSLTQMLWYLAMTEAIMLSRGKVTLEVDEDVRSGALAVQLIRPLSYPLYRLFTALGERLISFSLSAVAGTVIVLVLVGPISFSFTGLILFALALPLAFVLDFLSFFCIGLCAFWLEDTSGLMLIYSRLTMILGGMLIPLELFPEWSQSVLRALPFSSIVYGPAKLFVTPSLEFFLDLLLRQGLATLVGAVLVMFVYRAGLKRISAQGG